MGYYILIIDVPYKRFFKYFETYHTVDDNMRGMKIRYGRKNIGKNREKHDKRTANQMFGRFKTSTAATVLTLGLTIAAPIMLSGCATKQETEQTGKKPNKKHPEMQGNIGKAVKPATEKNVEEPVFDSESVRETAIEAVKAGDVQKLNELLEDIPHLAVDNVLKTRDKDGKTLLIMASAKGDAEMVEFLLEQNVSIKQVDINAKTALDYAVENNDKKIIDLISKEQEHLNKMLLISVSEDFYAKSFLDDGADPNITDKHGRTPLIIASSFGSADSVKLLLEAYDVDVDVKDKKGETAIMKAARAGSAETIKLLIRHGADRLEQNNDGENALMLVMWNGNEEAIEAMKKTSSM